MIPAWRDLWSETSRRRRNDDSQAEALAAQSFSLGNGQNFSRVDALDGELIRSVNFLSTGIGVQSVWFEDMSQTRIGGVSTALPELGALALFGAILCAFAASGRRAAYSGR